jgi:hypothetical protein
MGLMEMLRRAEQKTRDERKRGTEQPDTTPADPERQMRRRMRVQRGKQETTAAKNDGREVQPNVDLTPPVPLKVRPRRRNPESANRNHSRAEAKSQAQDIDGDRGRSQMTPHNDYPQQHSFGEEKRNEKQRTPRERKPIVSVHGRDLSERELQAKGLHRIGKRERVA